MRLFAKDDKIKRIPRHRSDGPWETMCFQCNADATGVFTVSDVCDSGIKLAELEPTSGWWNTDFFYLEGELPDTAAPEPAPAISESLPEPELSQRFDELMAEIADLKEQLRYAQLRAAESEAKYQNGEEILKDVVIQREAAVAAAKTVGDDLHSHKRSARHERYELSMESNYHKRVVNALINGLEDVDLDGLIKQLNQIGDICDEQMNGADAKLCYEAASALSIAHRAVQDGRDVV